jgi:signal peptidase II
MNEQNMRARLAHFGLVPGIAALDLITKAWARADLRYGESVEILPFFNLTLGFNRGVAFGLLNDAGDAVVLIVTAAISVMFGFWFWREPRALTRLGLAFVLAGAIGNFLDRLWRGEVTDFFSCICSGRIGPRSMSRMQRLRAGLCWWSSTCCVEARPGVRNLDQ